MNKENAAATPTFTRKRAKSFSTPTTAKPLAKSARGILKSNNGDDAHTIAFIPIHSPSKKRTESAEKRRKSLNRRVSFASHASVRLFEKSVQSPPQTTPRRSGRLGFGDSPTAARVSDSPSADDESNDELTMDLTNIVPRAAPIAKQTNPLSKPLFADESDSDSDDSDSPGEDLDDDTAAMDLTDILPAPANHARMSPFSRIPRRSLSPVKRGESPANENDNMDMTAVVGKVLSVADVDSPVLDAQAGETTMDMTRIIGGIIHAAQSAPNSPARGGILHSNPNLLNRQAAPCQDDDDQTANMEETRIFSTRCERESSRRTTLGCQIEDDQTVNMEETRVFSARAEHGSDRRITLGSEEHTSHTSYTVATEEDTTQRLCEGSITQADGFTQNMILTRTLPGTVQAKHEARSPTHASSLGFSWGAVPAEAEQSLMDVSMTDVTQNDDTVNMDMTCAIGANIFGISSRKDDLDDEDMTTNMDFTRVLPRAAASKELANGDLAEVTTPRQVRENLTSPDRSSSKFQPRVLVSRRQSGASESASPAKSSVLQRRLSSGAVRSPRFPLNTEAAATSQLSTPVRAAGRPSPRKSSSVPRRRSLVDAGIPEFGSPKTQALLEPGSIHSPEFGSDLIDGNALRMSILRSKIQSLTPRKETVTSLRIPQGSLSSVKSPPHMRQMTTPRKTPQRSLIAPLASASRNAAITPARNSDQTPMSPIALKDFLEMTGISFLTGLSTSRRRETLVVGPNAPEEDSEVAMIHTKAFTIPMLEMYQHSCRELTKYITEGRAMCDEIESDINEQNPEVFDQYRKAGPSEKLELEARFKEMKTMARLSAKGVWYVWKENLLSGVLVPLRKNLADLEAQKAYLEDYDKAATPHFEQIQREHDELKTQLELLQKEEEQYQAYDHEEAARLSRENKEGKEQLEAEQAILATMKEEQRALDAEYAAMKEQFEAKSAEVEILEKEAERCRGYTNEEIMALKRENEELTARTGLRLQCVEGDTITLLYKSSLVISMHTNGSNIQLSLPSNQPETTESATKRHYLTQIRQILAESCSTTSTYKDTLKFVRDQWSLVLDLQTEIEHLESNHPISVNLNEDNNLQITACVLLLASRTKLVVKFTSSPQFSPDDLSLKVDVDIKYGVLDGAKVKEHIQSRLAKQSLHKKSKGWLLDCLRMPEGL